MELLNGINLEKLVKQHGPQCQERVIYVLTQVCHSLAEAHDQGMTHRDIKPANIQLCQAGALYDHVIVLDFGLVLRKPGEAGNSTHQQDQRLTARGFVVGTPEFMAPEQALDSAIDGRADIYAVGLSAYWMLAGRTPFDKDDVYKLLATKAHEEATPLSDYCQQPVHPELERLIMSCIKLKPADRPQSAYALIETLEHIPLSRPWNQTRAREWQQKSSQ